MFVVILTILEKQYKLRVEIVKFHASLWQHTKGNLVIHFVPVSDSMVEEAELWNITKRNGAVIIDRLRLGLSR